MALKFSSPTKLGGRKRFQSVNARPNEAKIGRSVNTVMPTRLGAKKTSA